MPRDEVLGEPPDAYWSRRRAARARCIISMGSGRFRVGLSCPFGSGPETSTAQRPSEPSRRTLVLKGTRISGNARTSVTHPLRVDWLPLPWPGRVGLTFAPGKKQTNPASGAAWDRDLTADLDRLQHEMGVGMLVCLLEDHEFSELQITDLPEAARRRFPFHRFPIPDVSVPTDTSGVAELVREITEAAQAGRHVVIHCKGGLGRAGTIAGCVLRVAGLDGRTALATLREVRSPSAPETSAQRRFIEQFVG